MSEQIFYELTQTSQRKFNGLRRSVQFFNTFAGGVIEALREMGYRLSQIEKQLIFQSFISATTAAADRRQALSQASQASPVTAGKNIELHFEQRDNDQCRVLIIPYRTDLLYVSRGKFLAQIGLELSRYSSNPDVLREALEVNSRGQVGGFIGELSGQAIPKLTLNSSSALKQPGSMTFELRGARLVVAVNVIQDLGKYRLSDFDLDIPALKADMEAYFYGLEKYLALMLQTLGQDETITPPPLESPINPVSTPTIASSIPQQIASIPGSFASTPKPSVVPNPTDNLAPNPSAAPTLGSMPSSGMIPPPPSPTGTIPLSTSMASPEATPLPASILNPPPAQL